MAKILVKREKNIRVGNTLSVLLILFLSGVFFLETRQEGTSLNVFFAPLVIIAALIIVAAIIKTAVNFYKLASNVPAVLLLFYTMLMAAGKWTSPNYLLVCVAVCGISCIYLSYYRTIAYIVVQNILLAFLIFRGTPVFGHEVGFWVVILNWALCLFVCLIMLVLTRSATIVLSKAVEHQSSFNNLLASTENYIAMIDDANKVIYASKTFANLGSSEDQTMLEGRPFIDLFPGKTLKVFAGRMLKDRDSYAEDWEFSLNGQKRYFKTASYRLPGKDGGSLISLYDMTYLAERDEIAAMKDSMKIGLFFMDQNFVIQDHYSRYLEEVLSDENLAGQLFTDVISSSVNSSDLEGIKDYLGMVLERSYDQEMLDDINPMNELHYVSVKNGDRKVLQCEFATIERGHGEVFLLVTVYDITVKVELQQRLAEEESKRQEEMQSVFELVQVDPAVFNDFIGDMEEEFQTIDGILKNEGLSAHEVLVKVYQSVHAIKSNAVILGLNVFGNKVHALESKIKAMRESDSDVSFNEMLNLAMDIEKLSQEREGFKEVLNKLRKHMGSSGSAEGGSKESPHVKVLLDSLAKTTERASTDMGKVIRFVAREEDIDKEAIDNGPRRVMKEILMQLIRNSCVHGVEEPEVRAEKGKKEQGIIKLSIKMTEDKKHIHIKLQDDGGGLNYKKISEKAVAKKLIKPEDANKAIFSPGFSTAETEGVHAGRGIGLNLVRDRVKEVNGTIKVKSETGKGIIFFVSIPVPKP